MDDDDGESDDGFEDSDVEEVKKQLHCCFVPLKSPLFSQRISDFLLNCFFN